MLTLSSSQDRVLSQNYTLDAVHLCSQVQMALQLCESRDGGQNQRGLISPEEAGEQQHQIMHPPVQLPAVYAC